MFEICGKTLVQPNVNPPGGRYQISKPLVSKFVSDDRCYGVFFAGGGDVLFVEEIAFSAKKQVSSGGGGCI